MSMKLTEKEYQQLKLIICLSRDAIKDEFVKKYKDDPLAIFEAFIMNVLHKLRESVNE